MWVQLASLAWLPLYFPISIEKVVNVRSTTQKVDAENNKIAYDISWRIFVSNSPLLQTIYAPIPKVTSSKKNITFNIVM